MKVLVLHSGGLDSTLCVVMAVRAGHDVVSLGIDYGQRHRIELDYAIAQCGKYNVVRRILRIEWDKPPRDVPTGRSLGEICGGVSPGFLPGRNAVFLTLACAEAAGIGAAEVWIGVNAVDFSGYPDCTPQFIDAFKAMLNAAIPQGPQVLSPLLRMSKPQIASEAHAYGILPGDTWSCYQPKYTPNGVCPCGVCDACILHDHAWKQALGTSENG